ncbi:prepilin-type N-terminal cleavage/methylation domain-containing protein [Burkholderia ubonensis]|uniref:prepilin-type N-terminal cleavage/methylation domain-containing protein n=1 Tax=Burkholderia ubonensis TaxID=101571 RepID=UPI0007C757BF|nr:prepilin-type N-terminal cleavage/methylation domain-containing protein [Burkholderia ubonensis]
MTQQYDDGRAVRLRRVQRGFTLLELSIVLVVIAIIVSVTVIGADVYRNAVGVRIYSDFVQGWVSAYETYLTRSGGRLPGDNVSTPSGYVNAHPAIGNTGWLCDSPGASALSQAMLNAGVTLPSGRGPGRATMFVYQDKSGLPHQLTVCLGTVTDWAIRSVSGTVLVTKTVMRITGLTLDLARQLNSMIDGRIDAGLGNLREERSRARGVSLDWSTDASQDINGGTNAEMQSQEVVGNLLLD